MLCLAAPTLPRRTETEMLRLAAPAMPEVAPFLAGRRIAAIATAAALPPFPASTFAALGTAAASLPPAGRAIAAAGAKIAATPPATPPVSNCHMSGSTSPVRRVCNLENIIACLSSCCSIRLPAAETHLRVGAEASRAAGPFVAPPLRPRTRHCRDRSSSAQGQSSRDHTRPTFAATFGGNSKSETSSKSDDELDEVTSTTSSHRGHAAGGAAPSARPSGSTS